MQYTPLTDDSSDLTDLTLSVSSSQSMSVSVSSLSSRSKKKSSGRHKNPLLSEPLTTSSHSQDEESISRNIRTTHQRIESSAEDDPFYVFKEDLLRKLEFVEDALSRYLHAVHNTDTSVNVHDVKDFKKQLKRNIKKAESTLKDLETTVRLVETSRSNFTHIDDMELKDRKSLVKNSQEIIGKSKEEMSSDAVKAKFVADQHALAVRRAGNSGATTELEKHNSEFVVNNTTTAQLMLQQQDETLDELDEAAHRVGYMAETINAEIISQNRMLDDMEDDLHDAEAQLGLVMGKLGKMLKTKSKFQIILIIVLILVAFVLFFLVIYT